MNAAIWIHLAWAMSLHPKPEGIYQGWWATTQWSYTFSPPDSFSFVSHGHFGFTSCKGTYTLSGDTIRLYSDASAPLKNAVKLKFDGKSFLLDGDSTIVELETGYDYLKGGAYYNSRKRW